MSRRPSSMRRRSATELSTPPERRTAVLMEMMGVRPQLLAASRGAVEGVLGGVHASLRKRRGDPCDDDLPARRTRLARALHVLDRGDEVLGRRTQDSLELRIAAKRLQVDVRACAPDCEG